MELQRYAHNIHRLQFHLTWTPKFRCKALNEKHRQVLKELLIKAAFDYDMDIQEIEVARDHLHILISLPPTIAVSECVRILKSISAREFFERFPDIRKQHFWSGYLWAASYYAETIGQRDERSIQRYIRGQLKKAEHTMRQLKLFH